MPLSQADRIAFSLKIVSSDEQVKGIQTAQALISGQQAKIQALDTANSNLLTSPNALINGYHAEISLLDGNQREAILEQDIVDAANHKLRNHFFPNDTSITVPSLSAMGNVWPRTSPFALTYAIGKNYTESYTVITKEGDIITAALAYITSAGGNTDIQNTTGQHCGSEPASCSNPSYTDQTTCEANGGTWTPASDSITPFAVVQTLKTNLVASINSLVTFLGTEEATITLNDPNTTNQTNNNTAKANINSTILPALSTWLAYNDFNTAHGQTTCAGFNSFNSNTLAPTKLHSTQLAALQTALNNRLTFITTRLSQINAILGTIAQDVSTGLITSSSGFYGQRYNFLTLRIDALNGSLSQLAGFQAASSAQTNIIANIISNKATYMSVVPTTLLAAPGNGTSTMNVVDASLFSVGDTVFLTAENQEEIQRAIKSITGKMLVLNDIVPAKFRPIDKARMYKDLS